MFCSHTYRILELVKTRKQVTPSENHLIDTLTRLEAVNKSTPSRPSGPQLSSTVTMQQILRIRASITKLHLHCTFQEL